MSLGTNYDVALSALLCNNDHMCGQRICIAGEQEGEHRDALLKTDVMHHLKIYML